MNSLLNGGSSASATPTSSNHSATAAPASASNTGGLLGGVVSGLGGGVNSLLNGGSSASATPTSSNHSATARPASASHTGGLLGNVVSDLGGGVNSLLKGGSSAPTTGSATPASKSMQHPSGSFPATIPVNVPHGPSPSSSAGLLDTVLSDLGLGPSAHTPVPTATSSSLFGGSAKASPEAAGAHPSSVKTPTPGATSKVSATPIAPSATPQSSSVSSSTKSTPSVTPTHKSSTETNDFMPSTILVEPPSTTTTDSATHSTNTASSQPTQLPGSISPANGVTSIPPNSTLIQIGFNGKLRYSFVATTTLSSSQIFLYIPQGVAYALGVPGDEVSMFAIQPYDNSVVTGYVATVAMAYVPTDMVDDLQAQIHNPNSALFKQADPAAETLMSMIDPSIPLLVGQSSSSMGGSGSSSGSGGGANSDDGSDNGGNGNDDNADAGASGSSQTRASSVGIGVGVVGGAAAYGAGMFWVARRYRKRRQLHQRSNSTAEQQSEGRAGGSAGRLSPNSLRSNRTQMISAPVMAENSLGWN